VTRRATGTTWTALTIAALTLTGASAAAQDTPPVDRPRARDLGIAPGVFPAGPLNAITDVEGVAVGHVTLTEGERVRTGVTAIVPHAGNLFREKVPGAVFVGNAYGKLAGSTQVAELGTIETPIVLTNTLSVGAALEGVVRWTLSQSGNEDVRSVNALVGETNDGRLNDIRGLHVRPEHAVQAIERARSGAVEEGAVGAGTGTIAFGWKAGIGTSSRRLPSPQGGYTVGVLVQANFGGRLTVTGVPLDDLPTRHAQGPDDHPVPPPARPAPACRRAVPAAADGSCMIVVATDAPLGARDLERLAARAVFGLARTGSSYSNGSGDYAIAFSTAPSLRVVHGSGEPRARTLLPTDALSPLFEAVLEATEEAVYNALLRARTTSGNGHTVEALPVDRLRERLAGGTGKP
jgi:D-aminopeptidase